MPVTIRDVRVIMTAPPQDQKGEASGKAGKEIYAGPNLVVVRIDTSDAGLYGLGCATYTQRAAAVKTAVETYLKPLILGRNVDENEDIWHICMVNPYWRNGPVLNNAVSGVDQALWDIKGKRAGMPVYQLLGGKCREGVLAYRHADGRDPVEVEDNVRRFMEQGFTHVRIQQGLYGGRDQRLHQTINPREGAYYDPKQYMKTTVGLFEHIRSQLGDQVELLHDIHERLAPQYAVQLAKALEPYDLFFLEDALPPEQVAYFRQIRAQSAIPLAMGELFVNPTEWMPLISERLIDYIRCHISQIGGLTPARKLAAVCEAFGLRTAWHGPPDVSPIGHAANIHLDLATHNFGIQEWPHISEQLREVFPGTPETRDGYIYLHEAPGWGVEIDEKAAAKYPCVHEPPRWTAARLPDGTSVTP